MIRGHLYSTQNKMKWLVVSLSYLPLDAIWLPTSLMRTSSNSLILMMTSAFSSSSPLSSVPTAVKELQYCSCHNYCTIIYTCQATPLLSYNTPSWNSFLFILSFRRTCNIQCHPCRWRLHIASCCKPSAISFWLHQLGSCTSPANLLHHEQPVTMTSFINCIYGS